MSDLKQLALAYNLAYDAALYEQGGSLVSVKLGKTIELDNALLFFLCRHLDTDQGVSDFRLSKVPFSFYNPVTDQIGHDRFHIEITNNDQTRRMGYVIPRHNIGRVEEATIEAAEAKADSLGAKFELWTEIEIFGPKPAYMRSLINYLSKELFLIKEEEDVGVYRQGNDSGSQGQPIRPEEKQDRSSSLS